MDFSEFNLSWRVLNVMLNFNFHCRILMLYCLDSYHQNDSSPMQSAHGKMSGFQSRMLPRSMDKKATRF